MGQTLLSILAFSAAPGITQAEESTDVSPGGLRLTGFGVSARAMFQPSYSGANLTTMASWNPELDLTDAWSATGSVNIFGLRATDSTFLAFRVLTGVAYQRLSPRVVPEFQVGAEIWPRSLGGAYFATALNLHYRLRMGTEGVTQYLDSVWAGYQTLLKPSDIGSQLVIGVRISFPPRPLNSQAAPDAQVAAPPPPAPAEVRAKFSGRLDGILFAEGNAQLEPSSFARLDQLASSLQEFPAVRIELQGHTDDVGDPVANRAVSQQRARAVADYLIGKGVRADRLTAVGYGADRPAQPGSTKEARAANRRVEMKVIGEGSE